MANALSLTAPAWHTIGWNTPGSRPVPMFRAHAWALQAAHNRGARFTVTSADRRDAVLARHNRQFGTHLHGQQYLYDHQHEPGFFAANPPSRTSHCLFSDGNAVYRTAAGGLLPAYMLGIDAVDDGSLNDCTRLVEHLRELGIHAERPYPGSGEAHHFVIDQPFAQRAWTVLLRQRARHHSRAWRDSVERRGVRRAADGSRWSSSCCSCSPPVPARRAASCTFHRPGCG